MNFEDTRSLGSGLFSNDMTSNVIVPDTNYGHIESKLDCFQPPRALVDNSASSFFSSFSSSPTSTSSSPLSSNAVPPLSLTQQVSWFSEAPPKFENLADRPRAKSESSIKKSMHGGRKRSIVFEEEEAELQRKAFLERNRIAASKCRQKKKKWMKGLESNYEKLSAQNERLRSMIILYQEEANALKTELLARDGLCSCSNTRPYAQSSNATTVDPRKHLVHETEETAPPSLPSVSPPTHDNGMLPDNPLPSLTLSHPFYLKK